MRRRFLADEISGDRAFLTGDNAGHLARVLRARVGQEFDIASGGVVRVGKIVIVEDERVEFALGDEVLASFHVPPHITLLIAVFKFDRMEWAIEKATELGASAIVPVIARRTETHLAQAAAKRVERWKRIAHEASQQARRILAPDIANPTKLKEAMEVAADVRVVLAESEEKRMLRGAVTGVTSSVALAVGPEGGWTPEELQDFAKAGWLAASLGSTILRAETAVVAACAVVASSTA